ERRARQRLGARPGISAGGHDDRRARQSLGARSGIVAGGHDRPVVRPRDRPAEDPTLYAAPCVPPFSGENGGATYNGVTAQTITVAVPESNNQAQASALRAAANSTDTQAQIRQTILDYIDIANHHFQLYGRQ